MNTTEKPCDQASDCATEGPFSAVVQEHIGWVYCAARRQLADTNLADDAVQAVFMALWQKRERLISNAQPIGSWLARATRYACNDLRKVQQRRENHERKAAAMRSEAVHGSGSNLEVPENSDLLLALDAAVQRLPSRDRDILVARYFQNQSARQTAQAFDISEAAVKKRITRAVIKLRGIMAHKNIAMDSTALAALLSSGAGTAPNGLLAKVLQGVSGKAPVSLTAAHAARSIAFHTAHIPAIAGAAAVALAVAAVIIVPAAIHTRGSFVNYVAMFNQRFGKGVTPQNNAAVPLLILFRPQSFQGGQYQVVAGKTVFVANKNLGKRFLSALGITDQDLTGPRFVRYQTFRKRADPAAIVAAVPAGQAPTAAPSSVPSGCYLHPWSAQANVWVAAWLHTNSGAMDVAEAATHRPRFFVPLVAVSPQTTMAFALTEMNPPYGFVKSVARALTIRAMLELQRGNIKSCQTDLLAAHRCAILISREHFLLAAMVESSIQFMASRADIALANSGKLSAREDMAYLHRLQALGTPVPIAADFDSAERWLWLSYVENPINKPAPSLTAALETWLFDVFCAHSIANVNRFQDQLIAKLKPRSLLAQITGVQKDTLLWHRKAPNSLAAIMINEDLLSAGNEIIGQAGAVAGSRMARIAFALAAYLKKHDTFPNRLIKLAPTYLSMIPHDPYTGKPFDYTASPNGCTLSSPGRFPSQLTAGIHILPGHTILAHLSLPAGRYPL